MNNGKIVADDTSAHIHSGDIDEIVIRVEFADAVSKSLLSKITGANKIKKLSDQEWLLSGKTDLRDNVFKFSVANNLSILTLQKEEKSLEEVFKTLTK